MVEVKAQRKYFQICFCPWLDYRCVHWHEHKNCLRYSWQQIIQRISIQYAKEVIRQSIILLKAKNRCDFVGHPKAFASKLVELSVLITILLFCVLLTQSGKTNLHLVSIASFRKLKKSTLISQVYETRLKWSHFNPICTKTFCGIVIQSFDVFIRSLNNIEISNISSFYYQCK